jgi:hypothetical protein
MTNGPIIHLHTEVAHQTALLTTASGVHQNMCQQQTRDSQCALEMSHGISS